MSNISLTGHVLQLSLVPAEDILHMLVCLYFFLEFLEQNLSILLYSLRNFASCHVFRMFLLQKLEMQAGIFGALSMCTVSKNDTDVAHYNFNTRRPILVIFGTDVAQRVFSHLI